MNKKNYNYFLDLHTFITKNKSIHFIINLVDFILYYLSLIDAVKNDFDKDNNKDLYSISNIFANFLFDNIDNKILISIVFFLMLINFFLYQFYQIIFKNTKYSIFFINFHEIFHLRIFPHFYFTIISKFNGEFLFFNITIIFIFVCLSIIHFNDNHIDLFVPDFISSPYDTFSCIIDETYFILKFFIPFSLKNKNFKNLILILTISINTLVSLYIIYIIEYFDILLFINKNFNILKISLNFFIWIISIIIIFYPSLSFFSIKFILIEINILIFSFIISWYLIINNKKPILENDSPYNIYLYFCFYFHKNYEYKLLFLSSFNEHKLQCGVCDLCKNFKLNIEDNEEKSNMIKLNEEDEITQIKENSFDFFNTLNYIMNSYKTNGFPYLVKNKKILLMILMTLKKLSYEKDRINQYLTLLQIYHRIINENKTEINDIDLLMTDIYNINDFIILSSKLIDFLYKLCNRNPNLIKVDTLFSLVDHASKLESKDFKNYLQGNKTIKNIIYQITICTIIYEETFNKPVHKSHFSSIREHYQDIEETLNLFEYNKQVTFNYDIFQDKMIFVRSGQEFYKEIGNNLFHLFPKEIYHYQKELIKNLICTDYENLETQVKKIRLIINVDKSKKLYNIVKINFRILLQEKNINIITIDGIYSISSKFLISYTKDNIEYYFGSGLLIKSFNSLDKPMQLENFKLKHKLRFIHGMRFDYSFFSDNIEFKVYKFGEDTMETKGNIIKESDIMDNSKSHIFVNLNTVGTSSTASSTFKNSTVKLKNARIKSISQTTKKVDLKFFIFQKIILIFILFLFILSIIEVLLKKKRKTELTKDYNIFTKFRLVYRTYNYMLSSFRSITCLKLQNNTQCKNYFQIYNNKLIEKFPNFTMDTVHFFYLSNSFKVLYQISYMNELWDLIYSNTDKSLRYYFRYDFEFKDISSIHKNGSLEIKNDMTEFMEAFKSIMNSFIIVNESGYMYINEPFYIYNFKEKHLINYTNYTNSNWRIELLKIILNYDNFCEHFEVIQNLLNEKNDYQLNYFVDETIIFLSINLFIEYVEIVIIIIYLLTFENVMVQIYKHLKQRITTKEFNEAFISKLQTLKELRYMYSVHPKKIIEDLQFVYDDYRKKIKEINKKKLEENKNIISSNLQKIKEKNEIKEDKSILNEIQNSQISKFSRFMFQIYFVIATMYFLIFLILWIICLKRTKDLFNNIDLNSQIESNAYKYFSYYQNILYSKTTIEDISIILKSNFTELILHEQELINRIDSKSITIFNLFIKYFRKSVKLNCDDFYIFLADVGLNAIEKEYSHYNFSNQLSEICKYKKFLNDYYSFYFIFQKIFGLIYRGAMSLTQISDQNRESFFLENDYYFETTYYLFLIYHLFRAAINKFIYNPSIDYYMKIISLLFTIGAIIEIIIEIIFLLIVIFMFMIKINFFYKRLLEVTDIIKIHKDEHIII